LKAQPLHMVGYGEEDEAGDNDAATEPVGPEP